MGETNEASVQSVVHTPGPWTVANNGKSVLAGSVKINQQAGPAAQSAAVAARNELTLQANAKLIAAAPDMLEALRRIVRHQDIISSSPGLATSTRHIAAQAIQHAT